MSKLSTKTPFGKFIAKLQIDKEVTQAKLAAALGYDVSYVSFMNSGKRNITDEYLQKLCEYFELTGSAKDELYQLASMQAMKATINLIGASAEGIELMQRLNQHLKYLLPEDIAEINKIISMRNLAIGDANERI